MRFNSGMVLITTLLVMIMLMIVAMAIISLCTGNLKIAGNITTRIQALELANSGCQYAIYELESNFNDPNDYLWPPGPTPTPITGLSFIEYTPLSDAMTDGLPGRCNVAYVNNLSNPNEQTVSVSPYFVSAVGSSTIKVPGETAIILAQGAVGGFKRSIRVFARHIYYGSGVEGVINISGGNFLVNGIENISTISSGTGALYAVGGINYNGLDSYRFFNGTALISGGSVDKTGGGVTIDDRFIEENSSTIPVIDWSIGDPDVTKGNPANPNDYAPLSLSTESSGLASNSITRPSFPLPGPAIPDTRRYYTDDALVINGNTFVNGSLRVGNNLEMYNNASLFVNGVLLIDDDLKSTAEGNIFVAGYIDKPSPPDYPYGLALRMGNVDERGIFDFKNKGVGIFTDGDIILYHEDYVPGGTSTVTSWLSTAPCEPGKTLRTFQMLGITLTPNDIFWTWYQTGAGSPAVPELLTVPGFTGRQILRGMANEKLIAMGYEPVPEEVSQWCSSPDADDSFDMFCYGGTFPMFQGWEYSFLKNPCSYGSAVEAYLQGVFYTHGTLTVGGIASPPSTYPMPLRIVGGVVAKNTAGISPQDNPADPATSHGGIVNLKEGSSIIICPKYFKERSGKFLIKPILSIYSWQEL